MHGSRRSRPGQLTGRLAVAAAGLVAQAAVAGVELAAGRPAVASGGLAAPAVGLAASVAVAMHVAAVGAEVLLLLASWHE